MTKQEHKELEAKCDFDHLWKMPPNFKGRYFCERCGIETAFKPDRPTLMRWYGLEINS